MYDHNRDAQLLVRGKKKWLAQLHSPPPETHRAAVSEPVRVDCELPSAKHQRRVVCHDAVHVTIRFEMVFKQHFEPGGHLWGNRYAKIPDMTEQQLAIWAHSTPAQWQNQ
jgi:hypothetical protein